MGTITRRNFMVRGTRAVVGAAGLVTLSGNLAAPRTAGAAEVSFLETGCGDPLTSKHKILVAYESRFGSTGEVAGAIGKSLCHSGAQVDVRRVTGVKNPEDYSAMVIGSAIHSNEWMPGAVRFVEAHRRILCQRPVAYFLTCLTLARNTDKARDAARHFLDPVLESVPEVKPLDVGLFSGVLNYKPMNFIMRAVMKRKMKPYNISEGDYRDWDYIRAWSGGLSAKLIPV